MMLDAWIGRLDARTIGVGRALLYRPVDVTAEGCAMNLGDVAEAVTAVRLRGRRGLVRSTGLGMHARGATRPPPRGDDRELRGSGGFSAAPR
jgi:hypothetical protein